MTLTDNPKKISLVERLVKEGAIDFAEAIDLLESDQQTFINWPLPYPVPYTPFQPFQPYNPYPWTLISSNTTDNLPLCSAIN